MSYACRDGPPRGTRRTRTRARWRAGSHSRAGLRLGLSRAPAAGPSRSGSSTAVAVGGLACDVALGGAAGVVGTAGQRPVGEPHRVLGDQLGDPELHRAQIFGASRRRRRLNCDWSGSCGKKPGRRPVRDLHRPLDGDRLDLLWLRALAPARSQGASAPWPRCSARSAWRSEPGTRWARSEPSRTTSDGLAPHETARPAPAFTPSPHSSELLSPRPIAGKKSRDCRSGLTDPLRPVWDFTMSSRAGE